MSHLRNCHLRVIAELDLLGEAQELFGRFPRRGAGGRVGAGTKNENILSRGRNGEYLAKALGNENGQFLSLIRGETPCEELPTHRPTPRRRTKAIFSRLAFSISKTCSILLFPWENVCSCRSRFGIPLESASTGMQHLATLRPISGVRPPPPFLQ